MSNELLECSMHVPLRISNEESVSVLGMKNGRMCISPFSERPPSPFLGQAGKDRCSSSTQLEQQASKQAIIDDAAPGQDHSARVSRRSCVSPPVFFLVRAVGASSGDAGEKAASTLTAEKELSAEEQEAQLSALRVLYAAKAGKRRAESEERGEGEGEEQAILEA
eukprot:1118486-Rhodomonas_salina.1